MNNPFDERQTSEVVRRALAQVLGLQIAEIADDDALVNDLGADSLDFVEFRHGIERQFGIVLPQKSVLDQLAEALGSYDQIYRNGGISELAAEVLQHSFFRYGSNQVRPGMHGADIMAVTTVGNWAAYCHILFNYLPEYCPDCGDSRAQVSPEGKAVCVKCAAVLKPRTGDNAFALALPSILAMLHYPTSSSVTEGGYA